jgi:GNAT superfamily N-acetyltransferase
MSNIDYKIRTIPKKEDIESVREIVASTSFFRDDEVQVAVELVEERLEKGIVSGYEFVFIEIDGKVAAYACFGLIPCSLISYDLYWIATGKDFQNRGLGRMILNEVEKSVLAKGGKTIYIETSSKPVYEPTRQFYLRTGYSLRVQFEDFYDINDDKQVYIKTL